MGTIIEKEGSKKFALTQTGLIKKVLKEADTEYCNSAKTPCSIVPLGKDEEGNTFNEDWEYPVVVVMLMYLETNSRPDIVYAVNQCARFTHNHTNSNATGIKRILRYLKATRTKGMTIQPTNNHDVYYFVDADFGGLWGSENDQDPICAKSRAGFVILFMGCPLLWVLKL